MNYVYTFEPSASLAQQQTHSYFHSQQQTTSHLYFPWPDFHCIEHIFWYDGQFCSSVNNSCDFFVIHPNLDPVMWLLAFININQLFRCLSSAIDCRLFRPAVSPTCLPLLACALWHISNFIFFSGGRRQHKLAFSCIAVYHLCLHICLHSASDSCFWIISSFYAQLRHIQNISF